MRNFRGFSLFVVLFSFFALGGCTEIDRRAPLTYQHAAARDQQLQVSQQDLVWAQAEAARALYTPDACEWLSPEEKAAINSLTLDQKAALKPHYESLLLATITQNKEKERKEMWANYRNKSLGGKALEFLLTQRTYGLAVYDEPRANQQGQTVYSQDECIGAVVMGQCHGSILPKAGYHQTCYGSMLNGQCIGPQF